MKTMRYVPFLTLLVAGCGAKAPSPEPIAMNAEVRLLGPAPDAPKRTNCQASITNWWGSRSS